jgi:hypothetical protein
MRQAPCRASLGVRQGPRRRDVGICGRLRLFPLACPLSALPAHLSVTLTARCPEVVPSNGRLSSPPHTGAMDAGTFELQRLSMFERFGLRAQSRWAVDALGRRIYVAERAGTGRPVVLIHGRLSPGGDWCLMAGRLPGHIVIPRRPGWDLTYRIDHRKVDFGEASDQWLGAVLDGLEFNEVDLASASAGAHLRPCSGLPSRSA